MNTELKKEITLKRAIITGLIIDFVLLLIASTVMDGGTIFCVTCFLVLIHWICNLWIILNRKKKMTLFRKNFIRYALLASIPLVMIVAGVFEVAIDKFYNH